MGGLPFSVYDFFGYLASGTVVAAGAAAAFVGVEPFQASPSLPLAFVLVILVYSLGQAVANLAGDLVERRLVCDRIGSPTEVLFAAGTPGRLAAALFASYRKPLPEGTRSRVLELAGGRGGEELFHHCRAVMRPHPIVQSRLDTFTNLYGFCRNTAVAAVLAAIFLGVGMALRGADTGPYVAPGWWLAIALVSAVCLFYRYLKFFRHYAVELYTTYAEREAIEGGRPSDPGGR